MAFRNIALLALLGSACSEVVEHHHHHHQHHRGHRRLLSKNATGVVDHVDVQAEAHNARVAADSAKQAAKVANQVAVHSIDITKNAQSALTHARDALHGARVDSQGLSQEQKESLRTAEEKLRAATKSADYGKLKDGRYVEKDGHTHTQTKLDRLQDKLDSDKEHVHVEDADQIRSELRSLREKLAEKRLEDKVVTDDGVTAEQMEQQLRDLEKMPASDETKAEMERLRSRIEALEKMPAPKEHQLPEDTHALSAEEEKVELEAMRTRLKRLEALESGLSKEHEVDVALKKLRALKAAGEPIPEGAPSEEELLTLRKRLRSEDAEYERKLHTKKDYDIQAEIASTRRNLGMRETEYEHLSYRINSKRSGAKVSAGEEDDEIDLDKLGSSSGYRRYKGQQVSGGGGDVTLSKGAFDIDTEMPYGELEPFGREDTAQELTESSIHESDEMVDQLERAEVAEEKRSVFRALTRLRGAAITSFDGVARSQTGNIDEYNKTHKWRKTHPLHHLADEESDISKWAFPDNADF